MPRLMEKDDLMRTAVDLGRAQEVWTDTFDTASGEFSFSLPHGGCYQIVVMRVSPLERLTPPAAHARRCGHKKGAGPGGVYTADSPETG